MSFRGVWVRIGHLIFLAAISGYVLAIFLKPLEYHYGIDDYYRSRFLDMVEGRAYKPYVYRTLLPTAVRVISSLTPVELCESFAGLVERQRLTSDVFRKLHWESSAAYQYAVATTLMLLCFMGFAHYAARLTVLMCKIPDTLFTNSLLAASLLLGLPPFFRYGTYLYDPPQLFLFTLALYFLGSFRLRAFAVAFGLCSINKETALLLIPVYAATQFRQSSRRRYWGTLAGLVVVYVAIKASLAFVFQSNPGSIVEFTLDHNFKLLTRGWYFTDVALVLVTLVLLSYGWSRKPYFLRVSFLCTLIPLGLLGVFFGHLDEWRIYYEAYPPAFGLVMDSLLRLRAATRPSG